MVTEIKLYREHIFYIEKYSETTDPAQAALIALWCHFRNFSNENLYFFIQKKFGNKVVDQIDEYLVNTWIKVQAGEEPTDRNYAMHILEILRNCSWDHDELVEENSSMEHQSWLAISILGPLEEFINNLLNYNKAVFAPCLKANYDTADYVDEMTIGESNNYTSLELEDQRNFLQKVRSEVTSSLEIGMYQNRIRLK